MTEQKLDRYTIQSELGHGAMGVVYKATDPMLDRTVAIKTISLSLSKEEIAEFEQRFYREAKSAGRLNHPNIVTIYDIGRTGDLAYLAMEFLEGRTLREMLDDDADLPTEQIAEIAAQVADGLQAAHDAQVVHRDIKPANIMILANGTAKITDFGVALIPSAARTQAGMILGSPKYMSPEQVVGRDLDGRSDIFSLGVMLYEMLAGKAPFMGENINAIMYKIINETPPPPSSLKPGLPPVLDAIVAKAMSKHPDDRYGRASELAHDLHHFRDLTPAKITRASHGTLERRTLPRQAPVPDGDKTVATGSMPATAPASAPSGNKLVGRALIALGVVMFAGGIGLVFHARSKSTPTAPSPAPAAAVEASKETTPVASPEPAKPTSTPSPAKTPAPKQEAAKPVPAKKAETAPATKPAPAPSRQGEAAKTGILELWISPWGDVYVNDKMVGTSPPLRRLPLPVGKHHVEIRSQEGFPYHGNHEIKAGETTRITKSFP